MDNDQNTAVPGVAQGANAEDCTIVKQPRMFIEVRLSNTAQDWQTLKVAEVPLSGNGDLHLSTVKEYLGLINCRVELPQMLTNIIFKSC